MPLFKDPYPNCPNETRVRVQAEIDPTDYKFLFRQVLGVRGCQEPIVGTLLKALANELRKPEHAVSDAYDDDNFGKVQSIIDRVNFNPVGLEANTAGLNTREDYIRFFQVGEASKQAVARRTDSGATRRPRPSHVGKRKTQTHPSNTNPPHVTPDPQGKATGGE